MPNACVLIAAGRTRDFGESPVKRARLEQQGFGNSPAISSVEELLTLGEALVASEAVPSQLTLDLAPGAAVEYRSRHPYFVGGWFRAKVLQVCHRYTCFIARAACI